MIVADASALVSLSTVDLLDALLTEFDVHTTETVLDELEERAEYDDRDGTAATGVLELANRMHSHEVEDVFETSRVDAGEGSCASLATALDADFLLTDDLRALPELQAATDAQVATSPIVLKALVKRGVLGREEAKANVEQLGRERDCLEAPLYRRAEALFE